MRAHQNEHTWEHTQCYFNTTCFSALLVFFVYLSVCVYAHGHVVCAHVNNPRYTEILWGKYCPYHLSESLTLTLTFSSLIFPRGCLSGVKVKRSGVRGCGWGSRNMKASPRDSTLTKKYLHYNVTTEVLSGSFFLFTFPSGLPHMWFCKFLNS